MNTVTEIDLHFTPDAEPPLTASTTASSSGCPPVLTKPILYGPERPAPKHGYEYFKTPKYLTGFSRKVLYDLERTARLSSGRFLKLYFVDKAERCPVCTNIATGEKLLANCKVCHGTGYKNAWTEIGGFWSYVDFSPEYKIATPNGNVENPGGQKDQIIILGAPRINDQSLIVFPESREIFKIYDIRPFIIAMRGDIVAQAAQASRLSEGSPEYKLLEG